MRDSARTRHPAKSIVLSLPQGAIEKADEDQPMGRGASPPKRSKKKKREKDAEQAGEGEVNPKKRKQDSPPNPTAKAPNRVGPSHVLQLKTCLSHTLKDCSLHKTAAPKVKTQIHCRADQTNQSRGGPSSHRCCRSASCGRNCPARCGCPPANVSRHDGSCCRLTPHTT